MGWQSGLQISEASNKQTLLQTTVREPWRTGHQIGEVDIAEVYLKGGYFDAQCGVSERDKTSQGNKIERGEAEVVGWVGFRVCVHDGKNGSKHLNFS